MQIARFIGANMGPTWVLSAPDGPHIGPMNLAIRVCTVNISFDNGYFNIDWMVFYKDSVIAMLFKLKIFKWS